ncbi:hypothetical protein SJAV_25150 [Sulfurisphaera javensis]|uniref:Uncharacterized protein n=1 Tax=Sulfurisphaera javensis TaxID=2049879 RepID=A0AAT9GUT1_9CREN
MLIETSADVYLKEADELLEKGDLIQASKNTTKQQKKQ